MQTIEQELDQLDRVASPASEPDHHLTPEEADLIIAMAEAELKSLLRKMRRDAFVQNTLEAVCWLCIVASMVGLVYQLITYPHTLVVLYTRAIPARTTASLDLPTRTLAPITITRSATTATTGTGYQQARAATGLLTFYNGSYVSQTIQAGTLYTGSDGVQVVLEQTVTIPAASPPQFGEANAIAQAVNVGVRGNIAADDITLALSNFLTVKNVTSFAGGRDARTFKAVADTDIRRLTETVNATLAHAFTTAFSLQPGEAAIPTKCYVTTSASHQIGEEAQTVTLAASKTCSAVAYHQGDLTRAATAAFQRTKPGKHYHLVGNLQTTVQNVAPFTVTLSGKWAFTFSQGYQDFLAQQIQGESPAKAKATLLRTGVISYASVPNALASADYINFLVLVG